LKVKEYKKSFHKFPSGEWIENVIEYIVYPEKEIQKKYEEKLESEAIKQLKKKRADYFNLLSKNEQKEIESLAWYNVFKINATLK